ncbi:MAG: FtsQ-type POTRA domain-containing protein [Deltaproteobacteria bacterium]|jgi:cell division septal protein FtsQ|nr:FtsQ-type POTRA domain-containing protein [Deltaproteobacteria bacterium]
MGGEKKPTVPVTSGVEPGYGGAKKKVRLRGLGRKLEVSAPEGKKKGKGPEKKRDSPKGSAVDGKGGKSRREFSPGEARRRFVPTGTPGTTGTAAAEREGASENAGRVLSAILRNGPRAARKILSLALVGVASAAVLALVSAGCVWAYLFFSESDYFMIKNHDIKGIFKVSRKEILEATGLSGPVNFLTFDTVAAVRSLKSLPWVEDATISRTPPPDGVTIRVTEFKPKAVVSLGELHYLDRKGRPFKSLSPGENPDFPLVTGFTSDELLNGGPLTKKAVGEIFELMDILAEREDMLALENISEFHHDRDIGITIYTRNEGMEIRMGFGPHLEKTARLAKVLARAEVMGLLEGMRFANLECVPRVIVRYDKGRRPKAHGIEPLPEDGDFVGGSGGGTARAA